jgi:phage terminase large subunit-like protein
VQFGLRLGSQPRVLIATTPTRLLKSIIGDPKVTVPSRGEKAKNGARKIFPFDE